ncbi:ATP-dependent helicase HrpB [Jatrophihabitans sp.]|uniref:ATP-dependent helicase HrpB n=1 Tax=Jatrophihabitans sp. TaxID=1932789 RepID=UPI0030C705A3|nr:hrpB 1 [Jatrophihabitans sp.]
MPSLLPPREVPGADLPVRSALPELISAVRRGGSAVLVSPPGSGKTSLLPLALADALEGRILVAEPRRIATRAAAGRLAQLLGEQPGGRVGYAMRGERVGGERSRIEVVTTGLLVQRIQRDPELSGVVAVVIDECHERQLDADLLLAFCVEVRQTLRPELVVVAMSATPDTAALTRALDAPAITATAASHPVQVVWAPPPRPLPLLPGSRVDPRLLAHVAAVTRRALAETEGDLLVFVPGEREIGAVSRALDGVGADVRPLFGRQSRAEQDLALTPGPRRRIVVTTAVAESSLTVPGVRTVVDAGLAREPRTDQARGLGALITTKVSRSSAEQRAGRAGREGPGHVYRCWSAEEHGYLAAHALPEIATADLAGFALSTAAWGAPGGAGLALLDPPPSAALDSATALLRRLEATDEDGRITERGRRMAAVGAHPRLARAVIDGAELVGADRAREVVALLSDESLTGRGDDLAARYRELRHDRDAARRWRQEVRRLGSGGPARTAVPDDLAVGTVVGLAYPDRIARARSADSDTYRMTGGTGAQLAESSPLRGTQWLAVAVADRQPGQADARVRAAAPIDEATARTVGEELLSTADEIEWRDGAILARRVQRLGAIELASGPLSRPDPLLVQVAVRDGLRVQGLAALTWPDAARELRARLGFLHAALGEPWPDVSDAALLARLDEWLDLSAVRRGAELRRIDVVAGLRRLLPWPAATRLDELAPERLQVPSGSRVRVGYDGAEPPVVAVKLQELFGWTQTPVLADGRVPVVLHLLSPAGRPVAITADLESFWRHGYPQVRGELRARYPKHPWPEDPFTATATARTRRRG